MDAAQYSAKVSKWQTSEAWERDQTELLDALDLGPHDVVMDLGAHTGKLLRMIRKHVSYCIGIEPNPVSLSRALRMAHPYSDKMSFMPVVADLHVALDEGSVPRPNVIIMAAVLGHTPNPQRAFYNALNAATRNVRVGVICPNVLYDRAMAPANLFNGYKSDPTLHHVVRPSDLDMWGQAYNSCLSKTKWIGEKVTWLPDSIQPECLRSRFLWTASIVR